MDLAERLAATDPDSSSEAESGGTDSYRIRLHHHYLPRLEDAGIVDWDRERQTVSLAGRERDDEEHPGGRYPVESQDATVLADDCRREILSIVKSADAPITRQHLAFELAASTAVDGRRSERIEVRLHHCHLPKLADAGLLRYDRDAGIITYQGPSDPIPVTSQSASDA